MNAGKPQAAFSVVIPLYNKAPLIEATLRSALVEQERLLEVIVIDDGSTDGSAEVVARIDDPRIRLIRQANGGVSRARNRGIEEARGEWVAFLDADDLWSPDYLPRLAELAARYPACDMIATGYMTDGSDALHHAEIHPHHFGSNDNVDPADGSVQIDDYFAVMADGQLCCTISTAVRRRLLITQSLRFPEGESLGEDLDFFLKVSELTPVAFCPEPLAIYVQSTQVTRLSHLRPPEYEPPFLKRLDNRLRKGGIHPKKRESARHYLATKYEAVVLAAIADGQRRTALRLLRNPVLMSRPTRWAALMAFAALPAGWIDQVKSLRRRFSNRRRLAPSATTRGAVPQVLTRPTSDAGP